MLNKLLKIVEKQLQREYPDKEPTLSYTYGHMILSPWKRSSHGIIALTFIKDGIEIGYRLNRVSIDNDKDTLEEDLTYIRDSITDSFINNLMYANGPLSITEVLSGESELEDSMIIK